MVETNNFQPEDQESNTSIETLLTSKIVDQVENVRVKTSGPAIRISRTLVYGLTATIIILIAPFSLSGLVEALLRSLIFGFFQNVQEQFGLSIFKRYVMVHHRFLIWRRRPKAQLHPKKVFSYGRKDV